MSAHDLSVGKSDEWYTPAIVFEAMGARFDLDVSAPAHDHQIPAYDWCGDSYHSDSLNRPWFGLVWMNPPFGKRMGIRPWLDKFFAHGNGVALVPDRTSAPWWIDSAAKADAILFIGKADPPKGQPNKIQFIPGPGVEATSNGSGTNLLAIGERGVLALENAERAGLGLLLERRQAA